MGCCCGLGCGCGCGCGLLKRHFHCLLSQEQAKFSSFKAAPVKISGSPFRPERSKMPLTEVTHHSSCCCRCCLCHPHHSSCCCRRCLCHPHHSSCCCRCCLCHPLPQRVCDSSHQVTPFELNTDKRKEDRLVSVFRHAHTRGADCAQGGVRDEEEREDAHDGLRQGWAACCSGDVLNGDDAAAAAAASVLPCGFRVVFGQALTRSAGRS